jgi:hypothetical protein
MALQSFNTYRKALATGQGSSSKALANAEYSAALARVQWPLSLTLAANQAAGQSDGGNQDYYDLGGRDWLSYHIDGVFTASLQWVVSNDGLHWFTLGVAITAPTAAPVVVTQLYYRYLALAVSGYTAGPINVHMLIGKV